MKAPFVKWNIRVEAVSDDGESAPATVAAELDRHWEKHSDLYPKSPLDGMAADLAAALKMVYSSGLVIHTGTGNPTEAFRSAYLEER